MNILIDGQTLESPEIRRGIGVYFKNVLSYMVKHSCVHEWFITVSDEVSMKELELWVAKQFTVIVDPIFRPCTDYSRSKQYTEKLQEIVDEYHIDVYWNPNPLMVNVLFPLQILSCKMYTTVYDLIPAIMPVKEWNQEIRDEYYRRIEILKNFQIGKICISESTKRDLVQYIKSDENTYVTFLAAESKRFYTRRKAGGIHEQPVIVFTGGFDYRKNMDGALKAYAQAVKMAPKDHPIHQSQLYFVCHAEQKTIDTFYCEAEQLGVKEHIHITGFISDADLKALYAKCDLFFFPSLYEGFGLPIVEAMLGGAFILSADNSSLPEVCGPHAILCNAQDCQDMAEKLLEALLYSQKETVEEKWARQDYALSFSWEKTASKTLRCFEQQIDMPEQKQKLALVTPWPNQQTGIANYVYKLIPYWAEGFDVDVFVDNTVVSDVEFLDNPYGNLYMIEKLDDYHKNYDVILYQIGNSSEFHTGVYQYLLKYPGVAEIHDYVLHPFFYHSFFLKKQYQVYKDALVMGYGEAGRQQYQVVRDRTSRPDNEKFPMAHSVVQVAEKTIFHNHWSAKQMNRASVNVVPHACFDREQLTEEQHTEFEERLRQKLNLQEDEILISMFGFVNQNKRPESILAASKNLMKKGYSIRLVFWGKSNMDHLEALISSYGLAEYTTVTGFIDKTTYELGLELSDLVVNLRYPSMGESSGTLCEAFKFGKPVIVSDLNQYTEFPDEVCWKIPVEHGEVECLTQMLEYLIENPEVRAALGENAKAYADYVLAPQRIAEEYRRILAKQ